MAKRRLDVPFGCPLLMYIKEGGREASPPRGAPSVGSPSRIPFPFRSGKEGKEGEGEGKGGRAPTPCPIRFGQGEARATSWPVSSLSTKSQ